jgi:putative ABC transport system permease protein
MNELRTKGQQPGFHPPHFFERSQGRVPFGRRSLLHDRIRVVMSIGALAFAVLLVLLLRGIMDGTVAKSTAYIDNVGADVFVATSGVTNMSLAASTLPEASVTLLGEVPGVAQSAGIVRINAVVGSNGETRPGILIGYDPARGLGGPWKLSSGRGVESADEAVIDTELARELGVAIGGELYIAGAMVRIVGLSSGTAAIAGKLVFIRLDQAQELLHLADTVSFVLLALQPQADVAAFAADLSEAQPEVEVLTVDALSKNDRQLLARLFIQPINVMSSVGFLVGLAIVGLTMYTTTAERMRDFGVLKAIGAPNAFLLRTVVSQAFYLGIAGFVLGIAAVWIAGPLIVRAVPDIGVQVKWLPAVRTFVAVLAMSLVGSFGPLIRILRVDPLLVFKR